MGGQEPEELEPKEQVVVNEEENTHGEYSPERKEFIVRLERASSDQMVGLAILNKGNRCQVYSVKPKGVVDYWNKENPTKQIVVGDYIEGVNGFTDYQNMREVFLRNHTMHVTICRK